MEFLTVDPAHPDPLAIAHAAAMILAGRLVAFPTETVYGLGADGLDADAVARIYEAKGRPAWNPVILHVATTEAAGELVSAWPDDAERLAAHCWPGPLTLVLPRRPHVPDIVTAGLDSVAVRVPAHSVALALLRAAGRPIAAPSANRFMGVSPTRAEHVVASLGDRVDLVLDGGPADVGIESTVVDLRTDTPTILRPGMLSRSRIEEILGRPVRDRPPVSGAGPDSEPAPQRAPGQAERHYAPRADVWLFDAAQVDEVRSALRDRVGHNDRMSDGGAAHGLVAALMLSPKLVLDGVQRRTMPAEPAAYARALYEALHDADARGVTLLLIERPPVSESWGAIRDRLARAAR